MFIVNESYSGGGSWRTATCPGDTAGEAEREEESWKNERERRNEGSFEGAGARSLLRFMRPLPSPLAQLSSRYNIVVYSEPRLRSVNHPSGFVLPSLPQPCAPSLRPLCYDHPFPPRNPPNLPDAARSERRSLASTFSVSAPMPVAANQPLPRGIAGNEVPFCLFRRGRL
jgi:hypothetical protein